MIKVRLDISMYSKDEEQLLDYDKETWKDGNVFEFPDLKSVEEFRLSCPINFKPEVYENDSDWDYHSVDTSFYIDSDNDELVLVVDAGRNWCD